MKYAKLALEFNAVDTVKLTALTRVEIVLKITLFDCNESLGSPAWASIIFS